MCCRRVGVESLTWWSRYGHWNYPAWCDECVASEVLPPPWLRAKKTCQGCKRKFDKRELGIFGKYLCAECRANGIRKLLTNCLRTALVPDGHKRCPRCGNFKPFSDFHRARGERLHSHCRECYSRFITPIYSARNAEKTRVKREFEYQHKPTRKCRVCGDRKPLIDFRDGSVDGRTCASCYAGIVDERELREQDRLAHGDSRAKRCYLLRLRSDGSLNADVIGRMFAETKECPYCGRVMKSREKTLDHFVPLALGGWHRVGNVVVCCRSCNSRKNAMDPLAFFVGLVAVHGLAA